MGNLIEVKHLKKYFKTPHGLLHAVDDVNFDIAAGSTLGIVSLEDILEEIVGEISDEYDEDEPLFTRIDERHYIFQGKIPLEDFYEITRSDAAEFGVDDDVETLAGLILFATEDFPKPLEEIRMGRFLFQVMDIDKYRIGKIKVSFEDKVEDGDEE